MNKDSEIKLNSLVTELVQPQSNVCTSTEFGQSPEEFQLQCSEDRSHIFRIFIFFGQEAELDNHLSNP